MRQSQLDRIEQRLIRDTYRLHGLTAGKLTPAAFTQIRRRLMRASKDLKTLRRVYRQGGPKIIELRLFKR